MYLRKCGDVVNNIVSTLDAQMMKERELSRRRFATLCNVCVCTHIELRVPDGICTIADIEYHWPPCRLVPRAQYW